MSVSNTHTHTHTHINTHPHTEEESLQGRLSYLLSHFSYHLGFVNSQWGGNAISGAAHSSLTSVEKKKEERKRHTLIPPFYHSRQSGYTTRWRWEESLYITPVILLLFMTVVWVFFFFFFFISWFRCWGNIKITGLCLLSGTPQSIAWHRTVPAKDWFSHWPCVIES